MKSPPEDPPPPPPEAVKVSETFKVSPIEYTTVKNSGIHLEWARDRADYVYQWKMLKPSHLDERAILARLMAATDDFLPRETHVYFDKPIKELDFPFWTIRVKDIADKPGAQLACEVKLVESLLKVNVWS